MAINILDSAIANRISAGEVVEKPASVVKELIDNSLDSGATEINVEIVNGGIDLIAIRDNGSGIEPDDIKKAFLPHATSKISCMEDLDNIDTLGFRGEALASIASVAQVSLTTKTKDLDYASTISVNGGEFGTTGAMASQDGTYIEVRNLFYNTPARRKFLRRPKTEESEITNFISRYILAHPKLKLKYTANGKVIFDHKGGSLLNAITCVYGDDITQNIAPVDYESGYVKISGYISKVSFTKPNTTYQTLLVNGRYVIDEGISKAVYSAYEEFLMSRQFPFFVINLSLPYDQVDVNVHPSKINVKFAHPSQMFDVFYRAVRQSIYNTINPVRESVESYNKYSDNPLKEGNYSQEASYNQESSYIPEVNYAQNEMEISADLSSYVNEQIEHVDTIIPSAETEVIISPKNPIIQEDDFDNLSIRMEQFAPSRNATIFDNPEELKSSEENPSYQSINNFTDYKIIGELFNEFLRLEKDDIMLLIDFHAGHERLLYDEFVKKVNTQSIDIQTLLVPYYHQLNAQEMEYILNLGEQLKLFGFELEQGGPNEIKISTVPIMLSDINLKNFVEDLLHDMTNQKPKINEKLDRRLMQKACKSAVKAGMVLNKTQINTLLQNLDINKPVLLCPHGRPIVSVVKRSQIEKWFKRIV